LTVHADVFKDSAVDYTNVALSKIANQPTCKGDDCDRYGGNKAVDGDTSTSSQTWNRPGSPIQWWAVDLGDLYFIENITIYTLNENGK
jgi:hypothetical protein